MTKATLKIAGKEFTIPEDNLCALANVKAIDLGEEPSIKTKDEAKSFLKRLGIDVL